MSAITVPREARTPHQRSRSWSHTEPQAPEVAEPAPPRLAALHGRGGRVLFEVRFSSEMTDLDYARLARALDLSTHTYTKQRPNPTSPGVARLDHFSGLFLERGETDGRWVLQARTWGDPAPASVHRWQLLAVDAAAELDRTVAVPEHLPLVSPAIVDRPVGEVANRRLTGLRRRLAGLP